jgi:hypothetical protein
MMNHNPLSDALKLDKEAIFEALEFTILNGFIIYVSRDREGASCSDH